MIGPELGLTQPGMMIVCGDSHTSTHGAFGALAFGIGTSEVEHVLASQCLLQALPETLEIRVDGALEPGVTAKDFILGIIGRIGTDGATGYVIEYRGAAIEALSMDERMTVCNMSIEAGARAGMIAPDRATIEYLRGRPYLPTGAEFDGSPRAGLRWEPKRARNSIVASASTPAASLRRSHGAPTPRWSPKSPASCPIPAITRTRSSAAPSSARSNTWRSVPARESRRSSWTAFSSARAPIRASSDLSAAAAVVKGRHVAPSVHAMVVPGSRQVKEEAEKLGLDRIFTAAGFEWREAGCSMCLGMNPDILQPGERCASTSNRNFEGRQGKGGRTHLVSPAMAAAAAIAGHFVDIREWRAAT